MEKILKQDAKSGRTYYLTIANNGLKYVNPTIEDGAIPVLHLPNGNTKTGNKNILTYGHVIPLSCDNTCECYTERICYGCSGNYVMYPVNQLYLADNMLYLKTYGYNAMADAIIEEINRTHCKFFRWFTVGDVTTIDFLKMMVKVGKSCPAVKFWGYTKKYMIVNHFIEKYMHGDAETFLNYTGLIFSHWRNKDGSYFRMINPYNMPTSEFIPYGMESEAENANHICPCSNPDVVENCITCSNPCYELKIGQSMALLEHSTPVTAARDKAVRAAHKAIIDSTKPAKKAAKKASGKTTAKQRQKSGKKAVKTPKKASRKK